MIKRSGLILVFCGLLLMMGCTASESIAVSQQGGSAASQEDSTDQTVSPSSISTGDETKQIEGLDSAGGATIEEEVEAPNQAGSEVEQPQVKPVRIGQDEGIDETAQPLGEVDLTPDPSLDPKYWPEWPLIPTVSARAKDIYLLGQQMGNDPHSFTTIGDCQSEPSVFMGVYDTDRYFLGEGYEHLEETIRQFKGSFQRDSLTVIDGMSVASVLSPVWADPKKCEKGETPLECEIRLHRPVIAFINLGTNWQGGDDVKHEIYMRQVVDVLIENGVVPIISTKGDNLEGDHRLNRSMARVANDYELPLWNFWRSLRDLPGKGIDGSRPGGYLTIEAWARRSFTGLQALDAVWRELNK